MKEREDYTRVRALSTYTAPCFRWLYYLTISLIIVMLGAALYFLYRGFLRPLPTDATAAHGWSQLYSMLFGLLLLFMSLIQIVLLLVLLRYRRFVYSSQINHLPLIGAAVVFFLYAAFCLTLTIIFFDLNALVLLPTIFFLLIGIAWLICYGRSRKLKEKNMAGTKREEPDRAWELVAIRDDLQSKREEQVE